MIVAHDIADDLRSLRKGGVGPVSAVVHRVEDPPVHGLEAVPHVGEGASDDDGHGVVEIGLLHLPLEVDFRNTPVIVSGGLFFAHWNPALDVEESNVVCVTLDEAASGFNIFSHEHREGFVGCSGFAYGYLLESPFNGIHSRIPQFLGVHFA